GAGADVLAAQFDFDGAVRMDRRLAGGGMACAAPTANADTQPALDRAGSGVAAAMPELAPFGKLGSLLQLVEVGIATRFGRVLHVLREHLERVHSELGGEILKRGAGQKRCLRMVRSAPRAQRTAVG